VADAFGYALNCHYSRCRRATGSAFKPLGGIERDRLRVVSGADNLFRYGDETCHDARCRTCGSLRYSVVHVTYGTLVDTPSLLLTRHIMVGSRAPCFSITDDLPQAEEF
jgi:hypothetical protein